VPTLEVPTLILSLSKDGSARTPALHPFDRLRVRA
jgi:hypothetical protein